MEALCARIETLAADAPFTTLVHADIALRNVIVAPNNAIVLLDFGAALIGDPRYDLAKIGWRDFGGAFSRRSADFVAAWADAAGVAVPADIHAAYVAAHALAAVAWVDKQPHASAGDRVFVARALRAFAEARERLAQG